MKFQLHRPRRLWIWEPNCSREIARSGLASSSVSRRSVSAIPSSSSDKTAGRESRRFAARVESRLSGPDVVLNVGKGTVALGHSCHISILHYHGLLFRVEFDPPF